MMTKKGRDKAREQEGLSQGAGGTSMKPETGRAQEPKKVKNKAREQEGQSQGTLQEGRSKATGGMKSKKTRDEGWKSER